MSSRDRAISAAALLYVLIVVALGIVGAVYGIKDRGVLLIAPGYGGFLGGAGVAALAVAGAAVLLAALYGLLRWIERGK